MKGFKKFLAATAVIAGAAAVGAVLYNKFKSNVDTDDFDDFDDEDFDDDFDDIDMDIENRGYTSIPLENEATEEVAEEDVIVDIVDDVKETK